MNKLHHESDKHFEIEKSVYVVCFQQITTYLCIQLHLPNTNIHNLLNNYHDRVSFSLNLPRTSLRPLLEMSVKML